MKVIQVLTHFLPAQTAGTEMYVYALQHRLQQMGNTGGVIIPFFDTKSESEYVYNGIRVWGYPQDSVPYDKVVKGFAPPSGLQEFGKLLDRLQPDMLHFHELSGSNGITVFHLKVAQERKIPVILTMHLVGYVCAAGTLMENNTFQCNGIIDMHRCTRCTFRHQHVPEAIAGIYTNLSGLFSKAGVPMYSQKGQIAGLLGRSERIKRHKERLKQIANICCGIVTLNMWFAEMLVKNGVAPDKITVIQQGLPFLSGPAIKPKNLHKFDIPLRLVFVGRIYPAKGLHLLLEAIQALPTNNYILDIYGPSYDDDYLENCHQIIGQNESVRFCGTIPPGQTVTYLQKYDLLIVPSVVTEMAPLVIQEAFAAGIPVIASHVYGNAEQIRHGENGLLFRFSDVDSLRRQIQACIADPALLISLVQNIKPPTDFSVVANSYYQLYQKLISVS